MPSTACCRGVYSEMKIIVAAGHQTRWQSKEKIPGLHPIKQLVDVGGIPLIVDTVRKTGATVVTHVPEIRRLLKYTHVPSAHRWLAETILSTRPLWFGKLVVYLGDVYYTRELANEMARFDGRVGFWGRGSELFGMAGHDFDYIARCCQLAVNQRLDRYSFAMLWDVYRFAANVPLRQTTRTPIFHEVNDTRVVDFDHPSGYAEWRKANLK